MCGSACRFTAAPPAAQPAMEPNRDEFIRDIDAALGRLACDVVLGETDAEQARIGAECLTLATRFTSAPWPGLDAIAVLLSDLAARGEDGGEGAERFARLESAWTAWKTGARAPDSPPVSPAGPAAPAEDDELEVLRTDPELTAMFIAEALDHLGTIEAVVLQLESSSDDRKLLNDIFRPFHTIKGNAGALGVKSVQEFAHKVENLLDLGRSGQLHVGPPEIDAILKSVDLLTTMINDLAPRLAGQPAVDVSAAKAGLEAVIGALAQGGGTGPRDAAIPAVGPEPPPVAGVPAAVPAAAAPPPARATEATVRGGRRMEETGAASVKVDTRKLDNLVDMVGELVIVQSIISADPALLGLGDERLSRNLAQLRRITGDLQRNAMSMRMVPIRQTFQKMARLVRDLSRNSGKTIDLVLSGEDTELDRKVVEDINDPLMHMVRNSVDHGIETADVRTSRGKAPAGRLSLSAFHEGGSIVIGIADDGGGLDLDRILAKAVAQGLVQPGESLATQEICQLIFRPGFSTAEKVTEISGRGVGMDVVRRNIEALRGRVDIQTVAGQGTTFFIKLPLTLAIVEGLLLRVGAQRFVLPTFSIRESLRPRADQIHHVHGVPRMIRVRDSLMPLVGLGELFHVDGAVQDPAEATVVVIEGDGRPLALLVDQLLGKQEVVIKSLGDGFAHVRGIAGGAILGDGRVGLILDAGGLSALMGRLGAEAA